jgi:HSP20 family molecular chaperone IbpA
MFDMSQWLKPFDSGMTTTDMFDPFDQLDHTIGKNLHWLNKPEFMTKWPAVPHVPQKYRVVVDCAGFDAKSVKTECVGRKLVVTGREEHKVSADDFSTKEFKKVYELPPNAESEKLVSFMTGNGHLVIEVPLKETQTSLNADLFPKIVDTTGGGKAVNMRISVPENIKPSKVHVMVKDRDLIIKAEDRIEKPDGFTRFYYYKRATMPENTDFNAMKCHFDHGKLLVEAPLRTDLHLKMFRNVPIEMGSTK